MHRETTKWSAWSARDRGKRVDGSGRSASQAHTWHEGTSPPSSSATRSGATPAMRSKPEHKSKGPWRRITARRRESRDTTDRANDRREPSGVEAVSDTSAGAAALDDEPATGLGAFADDGDECGRSPAPHVVVSMSAEAGASPTVVMQPSEQPCSARAGSLVGAMTCARHLRTPTPRR